MRIRLLVLMVGLAIATTARAQEVSVTSMIRSVYMGQQGSIFADKAVSQTDLYLSWQNGIFSDVWFSTGADTKAEFDKELDLIVGRAGSHGEIKYSTDFEYFVIQGVDVVNVNGAIGYKFLLVKLEAYSPIQKGGPRKGLISSVGFQVNQASLSEHIKRLKFNVGEWVKYDTGSFGFHEIWLLQGQLKGIFSLSEKTGIGAGLRWSVPITSSQDSRKGEIVWEFGLTQRLR